MKTNFKLLVLSGIIIPSLMSAQANLVQNPSFESGAVVTGPNQIPNAAGWSIYSSTPDLFDKNCVANTQYDLSNKFGTLNEKTGLNRYAGVAISTQNVGGNYILAYRESVLGMLTGLLPQGCYQVKIDVANADPAVFLGAQTNISRIQVVLRSSSNSIAPKLILTTGVPAVTQWTNYVGSFSITSSENNKYDRVEIGM